LIPCNQVQLKQIDKSLKRYTSSSHYKNFIKTTPVWGYTIMRSKKNQKECALKFVQPSATGKVETGRYPPGPGNVCAENNRASRFDNLLLIFEEYHSKLIELVKQPEMNNKKNICCLLELILRYTKDHTFYSYDKIWLKYK